MGEDDSEIPVRSLLVLKYSVNNLSVLCEAISASRAFTAKDSITWINGGIAIQAKDSQGLMSSLSDTQIQIGRMRFVSEKAIEQILSRIAIALNIQPDHRKNMRVQLVKEYMKWIGAPAL
jgi:hypothetical protein